MPGSCNWSGCDRLQRYFDDQRTPIASFHEEPYQYLAPDTSLDVARLALIRARCIVRLVFTALTLIWSVLAVIDVG